MKDENSVEDILDRTQLTFGDIAPLKNPHKQKSKAEDIPAGIRFVLDDGTELEALSGTDITLGRNDDGKSKQNIIDFNPYGGRRQGVSRSHALITITKSGVFLKDLNSTNGTFINGQQLYPMRKYTLEDGDEFTLGDLIIKARFVFA